MKVLSDILHKAGILKESAETYSSGGYSVLVRNATTQRLETIASTAFANIYTANGTLTGNRTISSGGFSLTINPSTTFTENITFNGNLIPDSRPSGPNYLLGITRGTASSNLIAYTNQGLTAMHSIAFSYFTTTFSSQDIVFSGGTTSSKYFGQTTGNWTIGGTSDAGYKLDVNGTTRIQLPAVGASSYFVLSSATTTTTNSYFGVTDLDNVFGRAQYSWGTNLRFNGTTFVRDNTNSGAWMISQGCGNDVANHFFRIRNYNPNVGLDNSAFVIGGNGSIGINKEPNLSIRLDVNGSVRGTNFAFINALSGSFTNYDLTNVGGSLRLIVNDNVNPIFYVRSGSDSNITFGSFTFYTSAQLAIDSTTKGFLQPRMTTVQRDAIASPATGLQVYNTTTNTNDFYNGTAWSSLSAGNIYTTDGTLTAARTLNTGIYNLSVQWNAVFSSNFGTPTTNIFQVKSSTNENAISVWSNGGVGIGRNAGGASSVNGYALYVDNGNNTGIYAGTLYTVTSISALAGNIVLGIYGTKSISIFDGAASGSVSYTNADGLIVSSGQYAGTRYNTTVQASDGKGMRVFGPTGNITIGGPTYTDAGYKLDVQGTTRVTGNVVIETNGFNRAGTNGDYSVAIGTSGSFGATASGGNSAAFGTSASASGLDAIAIGTYANASGNFSIALGRGAVASNNEFVVGQGQGPITSMIIGSSRLGLPATAGNNLSIAPSPANGTNLGGGTLTLSAGRGTGTGAPGDVIISTATTTSTGTTLQTLTDRVWVKGENGNVGIGSSPNAAYKLDVVGTGRFSNTLSVISTATTNETAIFRSVEPYIIIEAVGGSNSASIFLKPSTASQNATIQNRTGGGLEFYVNADYTNAKMTIKGTTVNIRSLPTSATGLSSGDIWNDAGTLKVA